MLGSEHTPAPSATGAVPFNFPSGVEIKVPVLAWLLCPAVVPEPLLMYGVALGWVWRGAVSHVSVCMEGGIHKSSSSSLFAGVQVPVPDSAGLHEDQHHELSAL